jgi:endonuclease-3
MRNASRTGKAFNYQTILSTLQESYGPANWRIGYDPISELIFTILTQNTSDKNAEKAFNKLTSHFETMTQLLEADITQIQPLIAESGLSNIKAPRIKNALKTIMERRGALDLWFLKSMSPQQAKEWLISIDGVGPKTAAVVLCLSLDIPALPVDTHVLRVTKRLGLIESKVSAEKAHVHLESLVKPKDMLEFHMQIIRHGRTICRSRSPHCYECPLVQNCRYANSLHPTN